MIEIKIEKSDTLKIAWGDGADQTIFVLEPVSTRALFEERDMLKEEMRRRMLQLKYEREEKEKLREELQQKRISIDALAAAFEQFIKTIGDKEVWRPIESAPKDGSPILLSALGWKTCWRGSWSEGFKSFQEDGSRPDLTIHATHWMPLPAPPK